MRSPGKLCAPRCPPWRRCAPGANRAPTSCTAWCPPKARNPAKVPTAAKVHARCAPEVHTRGKPGSDFVPTPHLGAHFRALLGTHQGAQTQPRCLTRRRCTRGAHPGQTGLGLRAQPHLGAHIGALPGSHQHCAPFDALPSLISRKGKKKEKNEILKFPFLKDSEKKRNAECHLEPALVCSPGKLCAPRHPPWPRWVTGWVLGWVTGWVLRCVPRWVIGWVPRWAPGWVCTNPSQGRSRGWLSGWASRSQGGWQVAKLRAKVGVGVGAKDPRWVPRNQGGCLGGCRGGSQGGSQGECKGGCQGQGECQCGFQGARVRVSANVGSKVLSWVRGWVRGWVGAKSSGLISSLRGRFLSGLPCLRPGNPILVLGSHFFLSRIPLLACGLFGVDSRFWASEHVSSPKTQYLFIKSRNTFLFSWTHHGSWNAFVVLGVPFCIPKLVFWVLDPYFGCPPCTKCAPRGKPSALGAPGQDRACTRGAPNMHQADGTLHAHDAPSRCTHVGRAGCTPDAPSKVRAPRAGLTLGERGALREGGVCTSTGVGGPGWIRTWVAVLLSTTLRQAHNGCDHTSVSAPDPIRTPQLSALGAGVVLGWVTSREVPVLHPFLVFRRASQCYLNKPFARLRSRRGRAGPGCAARTTRARGGDTERAPEAPRAHRPRCNPGVVRAPRCARGAARAPQVKSVCTSASARSVESRTLAKVHGDVSYSKVPHQTPGTGERSWAGPGARPGQVHAAGESFGAHFGAHQ
ncbi:hypothetical protein SUGI_1489180 [Cryptomeria japonica]|uniref:Uncharacterized protein n=1 Tax=Cryptomeria japonica TaxID=3369 RepID=A0AAD3NSS6_CRYJA|nr:hypothetical protein SUGI_1489180 [Cryptomeria japonica]